MDKSLQSAKLSYNDDHDRDDQEHLSQELIDDSEAPSLCDLPLEALDEASKPQKNEAIKHEDDFEFGSFDGPESIHMCLADDLFLDGHILPLQHSISSDSRSISRSESMDRISVSSSGFRSSSYTSSSSRSSSTGSRIINPFHSYPSPSPKKIRAGPGTRSVPNPGPKKQTSSLWEFLKTGLVRAPPDIVKARCGSGYPTGPTISRSRSCGSGVKTMKRTPRPPMPEGGGGVFGGCKFSVWAAEPVASNKRVLNGKCSSGGGGMSVTVAEAEAAGSSHHRTFEWLKDVTGVGVLDSV